MNARKRLFAFLFAALSVLLFTACGKWDYSREAVKAANEAQGDTLRVEFKVNQTFTSALRAAVEDNIQPNDVDNAMTMDKSIAKLLTSGYRLDVYALRADTGADQAAAQLADEFVNRLAGCEDEGFISMVKADNGYFYMAVLTYKHGGSGSSAGSGGNSGGSGENEPYIVKVTAKMDKNYIKGDSFNPEDVAVTVIMSNGETIETTLKDQRCTYDVWGDPDEYGDDTQNIDPNLENLNSGKYMIKNIKYKGVYGGYVRFTVEVKGYTREEIQPAARDALTAVVKKFSFSNVHAGTDYYYIQEPLDDVMKAQLPQEKLAKALQNSLLNGKGSIGVLGDNDDINSFVTTSPDKVGLFYVVGVLTFPMEKSPAGKLDATPSDISKGVYLSIESLMNSDNPKYFLREGEDAGYKNDYSIYVSVSEVGGDGTVSCAVLLVRNRVKKS